MRGLLLQHEVTVLPGFWSSTGSSCVIFDLTSMFCALFMELIIKKKDAASVQRTIKGAFHIVSIPHVQMHTGQA